MTFLAFLLFVSNLYYSQESNIVKYSISSGLSQSQVNKLIIDSRGILWVATSGGGVCSFDGVNFTTFEEKDGLGGNIVLDVAEGPDGKMYCISTWGGISIINQNKVESVISYDEQLDGAVSIEVDSYGTIWVAGKKLFYLEDDKLVEVLAEIAFPFVTDAEIYAEGDYVYVTSNNKLAIIDALEKKQIKVKNYPFDISSLYVGANDRMIMGSKGKGLFLEENSAIKSVKLPVNDLSESFISDIYRESQGSYWISTNSGVLRYVNDSVFEYKGDNEFSSFEFTTICEDAQGNLWFGTKGEGLLGVVNTPFTYYSSVEGLNKSDNFPIIEDREGRIWVGNNEEGVFIYDGQEVHHFMSEDGLLGNKVRALFEDSNGNVWVGTDKGLNIISDGFNITVVDELLGSFIRVIKQGPNGIVYVGTLGDGYWEYSQTSGFVNYQIPESANVYSFCNDKFNRLYVGTGRGCYLTFEDKFLDENYGLLNSYIGSVVMDKNGKIWVGTDREIARLEGDSFVSYTEKEGLTSGLVYSLYCDSNGFLWVGTNKGLDKITIDTKSEIVKIKHYGYNEGFKGIEVNAKGVFENDNGELYFSTIDGLHKYHPEFDYNYTYNTPVYLNGLKLFLEEVRIDRFKTGDKNWFGVPNKATMQYDENHLTFEFFAVDFLNVKGVEYTYFLEGFDKNWSPPSKTRYAVYSNIPPGNYVFKVKQYGNEFSQVATIDIRINKAPPPFYKSIWFILLCLFLFGLVIYYFTEYRTNKLRNQQSFLEAKIEERTLEILDSEKEKTVLLQEVHHRVKNNLQIIISLFRLQSHFTDNEEALELFQNSQNRIRSMSKIHEKLYESKDLSKIEVDNYVRELVSDLVSSYNIKNEVNIVDEINPCNISMDELTPLALIINEIITNALKYGLKDIENPEIKISLTQSPVGLTQLEISDNGPGFDMEIWENHHSMGVELIKTLTEQLDGEITLTFDDDNTIYTLKFKASGKN